MVMLKAGYHGWSGEQFSLEGCIAAVGLDVPDVVRLVHELRIRDLT